MDNQPALLDSWLYRTFPAPLGAVVFLVQVALGIMLFAVFQEYVPNELGAGDAWGGYLLAAYGGARFLSETPTGAISDRVERKLALLLAFVLLIPAIGVMGGIETRWAFLGGAAVLGLGTAFLWPAIYAISADLYPPARRGKVIGFLNVFQLLGFGIGALVGALLVERYPAVLFAIAGISAAAAAIPAVAAIPRYRDSALHAVAARRPPLRAIWSRQIAALSALILLASTTVAMIVPAIRPYGDTVLEISFSTLTIALIPGVVLGVLLYVPAGHFADRFGRMAPFLVGQGLLVAGMLTVAQTEAIVVAAAAGAVIFVGNVFSVPAFNAAIMDLAPESHRGTLIGLSVALGGLGLALGPAAGGAILEALDAPSVFRISAAASIVTAAGILAYRRAFATEPGVARVEAISR